MPGFLTKILGNLGLHKGDPVDWEGLEAILWQADLGGETVQSIMAHLEEEKGGIDASTVTAAVRRVLRQFLPEPPIPLLPRSQVGSEGPTVIFLVGVNGTGKTTTTAKLAHHLQQQGHSLLLAAADTFRAGATEQLLRWGEKLGVEVVRQQQGADPAALCHDALTKAKRQGVDFLICDTAGRLHTKSNLMEELAKVKRTVQKIDPTAPHQTYLVVDTTTGTNALTQTREFHQAIGLTGLILTKLDGSGKGGVAVAIARDSGIPTAFLGMGEQLGDLTPFDQEKFLERVI